MSPSCWSGSKVNRKGVRIPTDISVTLFIHGREMKCTAFNSQCQNLISTASSSKDWVPDKSHHWMFVQEEFIWAKWPQMLGLVRMHMSHLERKIHDILISNKGYVDPLGLRWKAHCNNCILDFYIHGEIEMIANSFFLLWRSEVSLLAL